ncbi:MAG: PhoP regulatory network YrbL family protein, partial [Opitutaceae bacterium]|nr:PhoP regulatory network YrbL family protein [Opitutaceae bacterium]
MTTTSETTGLPYIITPLKIGECKPIANGGHRLVFAHPHHKSLLLKVVREEVRYGNRKALTFWQRHFQRFKHYNDFVREAVEHIASYAASEGLPSFVQQFYGFVETDLGLAAVSRAELDRDGNYARNLSELITQGEFDEAMRDDFDKFAEQFISSDIVVGDLRPENLVYSHDSESREMHFVIIDGLGDKNSIPICSISKTYNRLSKRKRVNRLRKQIDSML